jgi:hypothetical protein
VRLAAAPFWFACTAAVVQTASARQRIDEWIAPDWS